MNMPAGTRFLGGATPRRPGKAAGVGHAHAAPYPDSWTILRKAVQRPSQVFRPIGRVRNPPRVLTGQTLCFAKQPWNGPLLGISAIPDGPDAKLLPGPKSTYRDQHIPRPVRVCAHPRANPEAPGSLRTRTGLAHTLGRRPPPHGETTQQQSTQYLGSPKAQEGATSAVCDGEDG